MKLSDFLVTLSEQIDHVKVELSQQMQNQNLPDVLNVASRSLLQASRHPDAQREVATDFMDRFLKACAAAVIDEAAIFDQAKGSVG